ncbi:MAG: phosphoadenosine phosphosulfate reductase family protein [Prevotella sp.]|nr:phosphoadenosine phosphosulfate reductase family protein [Prevotella sp.]
MKKLLSFSGGVESRTMAILYGNKADAIFSDTGNEHLALYASLNTVEKKIREFHNNDFKIIKVKNEEWGSLDDYIRYAKFFPSFNQRFCTRMFKIEPIDNYLKQFKDEGVEIMIGLNANEKDMRTGNHGLLPWVKYSYPLADNGIDRQMCHEILAAAGIAPNFPPYMQRGGCYNCYYKSKKEYKAMAYMVPDEFDKIIALEEDIQDQREEYYHIIPSIPNLREFKRVAQSMMIAPEEMYSVVNNATKCGVFCNR